MNVKEIRINAQTKVSIPISEPMSIEYINECLRNLANDYETACKRDELTLTMEAGIWTDLPENLIKVKEVLLNNQPYGRNAFFVENNQIKVLQKGDFTIEFLRMATPVRLQTDIPEIHSLYHQSISLFLASSARSRLFGANDNNGMNLYIKAEEEAKKAHKKLSRQKGTRKQIKAPDWD